MRVFKTKLFSKWAKKENLLDSLLCQAIVEIEQGLFDASLGGRVYKKRIGTKGKGKRGGTRSILAYQASNRVFFIYGYAKDKKSDLSYDELKIAKALATELLEMTPVELTILLDQGKLIEVDYAR